MRTRNLLRARSLLFVVLCVAHARADVVLPEYQVKAAFLYKFATYIRWPSTTGADPNVPFVIGVVGKDPFGLALDAIIRGQSVEGRRITIQRVRSVADAPHYEILFISASERGNLEKIFEALDGTPVLTVSDIDRFAELGGMINLVTTDDNRIRFDINKEAVERARLKAPSQLLRLARIVESSQERP